MDIGSGHPFGWSKTGSDFGNDKNLNEIETDYRNNKDLNQVETDYEEDDDNIEIETNYEDNEDDVEIETDYGNDEESIFLEVAARRNPLPSHSRPANILDPSNETASMAEFYMMRSSPPTDPMVVGPGLLTSAANWERGSTRDIYTRMPEVSRIRQAIYAPFGLKARPWQVSMLIDITQKNAMFALLLVPMLIKV